MTEDDSPREVARKELQALLEAAVDVATDLLTEASDFAPFALAIRNGQEDILHLEPEDDDPGSPEDVLALLHAGLGDRAAAGEVRATAVVSDVTVADEDDELVSAAIHVGLEHASEEPVVCVVPYDLGDAVELGEPVFEPGASHVFPRRTIH
jgi:hypothetical protein